MTDMTFQGTVWGCVLWNVFFANANKSVEAQDGFVGVSYADDLNSFASVPNTMPTDEAFGKIESAQRRLHAWGKNNQVLFDSSKESKHIILRSDPYRK